MLLNEKQLDLLRELLNIGIGKSSATLHELVNRPIRLSVPVVQLHSHSDFLQVIESKPQINYLTVKLGFMGSFSGISQIVFPVDSAITLVSILTGEERESPDFDAIKAGTLNEVANMLLNGVIGTLGELLGDHFQYSLPSFHEDSLKKIVQFNSGPGNYILYGESHFITDDKDIEGDIIIILEMPSLNKLILVLNNMLGETV